MRQDSKERRDKMIFFDNEKINGNDNLIRFIALQNGEKLGEGILDLSLNIAKVTLVTFDKRNPYVTEGIIRAAFNYAANKGFYMGLCNCENAKEILEKMNFNYTDGQFINDIPSILMGKCCCNDCK